MKPFIILCIFSVALISCKKQGHDFLSNFVEKEKKRVEFRYTKQISRQDLDMLMATNEANVQVYNVDHKYYYGYKQKLDERYYLIEFTDVYRATYRFTHRKAFWEDVFLCIYDAEENKVVSKLRVSSDDPIQSFYKEDNHTYTVTSDYFVYGCSGDCLTIESERRKVTHTYTIVNNRFQLVD